MYADEITNRANLMNGSRILIVDDDEPQREVLAGYLKKQRHVVLETGSVPDALPVANPFRQQPCEFLMFLQ